MSVATATSNVLQNLSTAANRAGVSTLAARLARIRQWLGDDLAQLERELAQTAAGGDLAHRAARHLLERPGKRIRPLAVYLAAQSGPRETFDHEAVKSLAVAAELVHAATLLHDDVIDEGSERRGVSTARLVYGNSASVLGGDHLLVTALQRVVSAGHTESLQELLATIGQMVAAEALQLRLRGTFTPERTLYMQVVDGKTAALFEWAMRSGGRAAGHDVAAVDALGRAGRALGIAFQLVDDVLDLEGDPRVTGKTALTDLREGKLTWPLIVACEYNPGLERRLAGASQHCDDQELCELRDAVLATSAVVDTKRRAMTFAGLARDALAELPPSPARGALEAVVDASVSRVR